MEWTNRRSDSVSALLNALSRTVVNPLNPTDRLALLPTLENLEFIRISRSASFVNRARQGATSCARQVAQVHKAVTSACNGIDTIWDPVQMESIHGRFEKAFSSNYTSSDEGLDRLPKEWKDLKVPIEEGLRFVVETRFW